MQFFLKKTNRCMAVLLLLSMLIGLFCIPTASAAEDMHISWRGIDLIKKYEGFHKYQYWDHQQWTIGYGTRCYNGQYPNGITVEQATADLQAAMVKTENLLKEFLRDNRLTVNQNQFDALVSFAYNVGEYVWFTSDTFTLRNYLLDGIANHTAGDFEYAFGLWCKAGGQPLDGLVRRRADEAALFNTPVATYKVTYNANGGNGAPAVQVKEDGASITISRQKPTRDGYEFLGWATAADSKKIVYSGGEIYSAKAHLSLYAVWAKDNTVTYDANGGSGAPAAQTKHASASMKLSTTRPTRAGYTFLGWSTASQGERVDYAPGAVYSKNGDITLYAVWREMSIVCFDAMDGSFGATEFPYGDFNRDGVTDNTDVYLLGVALAENRTLTDAEKEICDVDKNGKVDACDRLLIEKYAADAIPSLPAKLYAAGAAYGTMPKVEKEGAYFVGWAADPLGNTAISGKARVPDGVSVVYPLWSDRPLAGDTDLDGSLSVSDIVGVKRVIMAGAATPEQLLTADANGDGVVDVADIMWLFARIMD